MATVIILLPELRTSETIVSRGKHKKCVLKNTDQHCKFLSRSAPADDNRSLACAFFRRLGFCRIIAPQLGRDTKSRADPVTGKHKMPTQPQLSHVPRQGTRCKNPCPPLLWPCLFQSITSQNKDPVPTLCIANLNVTSAYLADNRSKQTRLVFPYTCLFWEGHVKTE